MKDKRTFFAEQLRKILFEKNLTQQDLGNLIGVKRSMISHWIRGYRTPGLTSIKKIASALDASVNYFIEDGTTEEKTTADKADKENNIINVIMSLIKEQNNSSKERDKKFEEKLKRFELELTLLKKDIKYLKKDFK